MRKIMISIALVALMLTGCSKNEGKTTAVENIATDTVATIGDASADATTEETAEEPAPEKETLEAEATTEVPATTEISGGKKTDTGKKEDTNKPSTTESTKPSTNHSSTSGNGGSTNNGQSTTPKPSNNGNSGSSSLGNSGNSSSGNGGNSNSTPSPKPSTPATTEAPTAQHQHNYNVWVKTKDAWDETVVDTPEQRIDYPEQGYWADAMQCHGCKGIFTSSDAYFSHPCGDAYGFTTTQAWVKTKDAYTETIPAKTHTVHHDEEGYWKCECGARK